MACYRFSFLSLLLLACLLISGSIAAPSKSAAKAADDQAATSADDKESCVRPTELTAVQSSLSECESSRKEAAKQLEQLSTDCTAEKETLQRTLDGEKAKHTDSTSELEAAKDKAFKKLEEAEAKLAHLENSKNEADKDLQAEVEKLQKKIEKEKKKAEEAKEALKKQERDLSVAQTEREKLMKEVRGLENNMKTLRRKNTALEEEVAQLDNQLTFANLMTAYYEEGVIFATYGLQNARQFAYDHQDKAQLVLDTIESSTAQLRSDASKLYADNLAEHVDPILLDVQKQTQPHIEAYTPVVQEKWALMKLQGTKYAKEALRRGKIARIQVIELLQKNEQVAPFAQKSVDFVLLLIAVPLALLQVRLVLKLIGWILFTILSILTCGYCCGLCARKRTPQASSEKKNQ